MQQHNLSVAKKITKIDLIKLNQQTKTYFYSGYDIYFIHGWFSSYLSAPSDSEEDLIIPTYILLDEERNIDEKQFSKFIDQLMFIYSEIADSIYEKNRQIKPLGSLISPNDFSITGLDETKKGNLLTWLYGYLCGYLVIGTDISEYCHDEQLLVNKFYPALYTICGIFLILEQEVKLDQLFSGPALEDYQDVRADVIDMWEEENGKTIIDELKNTSLEMALADFINALNTIFHVIRVVDEDRFAASVPSSLLKSLVVH